MIDGGDDAPDLNFEQMPLFSAFITDANGRRLATAFMLRVRVGERPWSDYYSHLYLVTALHAIYDKGNGLYRTGLFVEFPWMEEQGLSRQSLDPLKWSFLRPGDLPKGESGLDLAIASFTGSGFTGLQFGRSARAVDENNCAFGLDRRLLGAETVAVGLLTQHPGGPGHIEPLLRFGRVAAVPQAPVLTAFGLTHVLLVESSADAGMSGAPVFVNRHGEWMLLGIHVGHFTSAQVASGEPGRVRFETHSSIGIVIPGERLIDDLAHVDSLASVRSDVDAEIEKFPWRFVDRRHRELRGVVFSERYFNDMSDYEESSGSVWDYLCYSPDGFDDLFTTGSESLEWTTETARPLAEAGQTAAELEKVLGPIAWDQKQARLWRGLVNSLGGGQVDLFLDEQGRVQVFRLCPRCTQLDDLVLDGLRVRFPGLNIVDLQSGDSV
ncbi:hypothetical protein [Frigoribacterium sp. Leaf44]|uniref:hypothetical protein n=1 Tax=Frigoribacterium sp. Leaf44 TaxID=1736220 RepID=UPI000A516800|nr:hypothetical protein [Frigoribacterium sp. Leaf44]